MPPIIARAVACHLMFEISSGNNTPVETPPARVDPMPSGCQPVQCSDYCAAEVAAKSTRYLCVALRGYFACEQVEGKWQFA